MTTRRRSTQLRARSLWALPALILFGWAASPLAASSWCSCLPAFSAADCDGDAACLDAMRQVGEAERMLEQECLPDSECRAAVAEICSQVCAAIQGMDLSGGGGGRSQGAVETDPPVKRPPPREPAEEAKEKAAADAAKEEKTAKEKEEEAKAAKARDQECKELYAFRDGGLYEELRLQETKYELAKEGLESARQLREEINDQNWWTLSSIPDIAIALKITTGVIETALTAVSPGGSVVNLGREMVDSSLSPSRIRLGETFYNGLKEGKKARDLFKKTWMEFFLDRALDKLGAVGKTAKGLKDLAKDIQTAETLGKDKDSYRQTLREQTARLESEMRRYEAAMQQAIRSQEVTNGLKEGIDRYCAKKKTEGVAVRLP